MKNFLYRVKAGDTICSLAKRFGVPTQQLIYENHLKHEVSLGDIVFLSPNEKSYVVQPLQNYACLSRQLGVSEQYLKDLNPECPYLFYGLVIKI